MIVIFSCFCIFATIWGKSSSTNNWLGNECFAVNNNLKQIKKIISNHLCFGNLRWKTSFCMKKLEEEAGQWFIRAGGKGAYILWQLSVVRSRRGLS